MQHGVQLGVQLGEQLGIADQQKVLACLLGHCCEMQSLRQGYKQDGLGQGGLKAGGRTLLPASEWRKMRMAVVRGGCGGAGGRVGLAKTWQGADPDQTESCIQEHVSSKSNMRQQDGSGLVNI